MSAIKFLHTADWQLGMRRHFLDDEALPRFVQARIDVIRTLATLASDQECAFAVVCGDVFDSNQLERRAVARALEALATMPCPVYLLPGNHDPLDASSVYRSAAFTTRKPDHVHVIDSSTPVQVAPGVELVGAPWFTKRPRRDLVGEACAVLEPVAGSFRICVAHGMVDKLSPDGEAPDLIARAQLDAALGDGRVHYFALGDRHSVTRVGERIWYAGSPEMTDYDERDSGQALTVELSDEGCRVTPHPVGRWRFVPQRAELSSADDVAALATELEQMPDKEVTIVKLSLRGALSLAAKASLDDVLEQARELFAALEIWERHTDLMVLPDQLDLDVLGLAGFARETVEVLEQQVKEGGEQALVACDALTLLYRLAKGAAA